MRQIILLFAALFTSAVLVAGESPPACNLGALTAAERRDHEALAGKIFAAVVHRSETADGYAFKLDRARVTAAEVGQWIALEERCCPFFDFQLQVARDNGPLTLTLGGRKGVRAFIASELALK